MDSLEKWEAYLVDVKTLFLVWEARRAKGLPQRSRAREILTICIFTLCLENNENKRFFLGFRQRGLKASSIPIEKLFDEGFAEIEDCDVILVPDLGDDDARRGVEFHRNQLVSYLNRINPGTDDIIAFLEEKKLRVPLDDDLKLIVHLEQATEFDWVRLSMHLQARRPRCPYGQVFLLARMGTEPQVYWRCRQLYPKAIALRDMDLDRARTILEDRAVICVKHPPTPVNS